ncbi:hypothetical protein DCO58_03370 [Helicobacter saguini]|uniref:Uncharacterized protein n=1 Tax=Helicobacter saguini TaxID=1548018 RepID=A0A347VSA4_9HELI|nr:hypothetical protein [Helicobacter saguini]MWV62588.1 hypothetical protein [Helicobacter saguini]MWV66738.1 hypothetical protein [Helicobacter saguini]MWV69089.1 hypothetical protein [Helicobacter saguini]MWV71357.1 hypothetical protein [Helicobacter saguini]TLD93993.1 hypothetical protein LS64_007480 [Helicobacter saguini]
MKHFETDSIESIFLIGWWVNERESLESALSKIAFLDSNLSFAIRPFVRTESLESSLSIPAQPPLKELDSIESNLSKR